MSRQSYHISNIILQGRALCQTSDKYHVRIHPTSDKYHASPTPIRANQNNIFFGSFCTVWLYAGMPLAFQWKDNGIPA